MQMIDKKISLGSIITLIALVSTIIFTQGATQNKIINLESNVDDNRKKIMSNKEKHQNIEIHVVKLETMMTERFNRLEQLIIEK
tara:strand:+ start:2431 stop:2682 length:252 start_codon:yes stop_codon:yes gene_type:complete